MRYTRTWAREAETGWRIVAAHAMFMNADWGNSTQAAPGLGDSSVPRWTCRSPWGRKAIATATFARSRSCAPAGAPQGVRHRDERPWGPPPQRGHLGLRRGKDPINRGSFPVVPRQARRWARAAAYFRSLSCDFVRVTTARGVQHSPPRCQAGSGSRRRSLCTRSPRRCATGRTERRPRRGRGGTTRGPCNLMSRLGCRYAEHGSRDSSSRSVWHSWRRYTGSLTAPELTAVRTSRRSARWPIKPRPCCNPPRLRVAAWQDLADAARADRPDLNVIEPRIALLNAMLVGASVDPGERFGRLADVLSPSAATVARDPEAVPPDWTDAQRLEAADALLREPAATGHCVAWLTFAAARLPEFVLEMGSDHLLRSGLVHPERVRAAMAGVSVPRRTHPRHRTRSRSRQPRPQRGSSPRGARSGRPRASSSLRLEGGGCRAGPLCGRPRGHPYRCPLLAPGWLLLPHGGR